MTVVDTLVISLKLFKQCSGGFRATEVYPGLKIAFKIVRLRYAHWDPVCTGTGDYIRFGLSNETFTDSLLDFCVLWFILGRVRYVLNLDIAVAVIF